MISPMSFNKFTAFYDRNNSRGAIRLSPSGRLRKQMRKSIIQRRLIAWRMLPFLLFLFLCTIGLSMNLTSHLGEEGRNNAYQGNNYQFESPIISKPSPPVQASTPPPPEELTPPNEVELETELEIEPMETPLEQSPTMELALEMPILEKDIPFSQEDIEALEHQVKPKTRTDSKSLAKAAPKSNEKTVKKAQKKSNQPALAAQQAPSRSVVGESRAKASGRVSVSYKEAPIPPYPARMRAAKIEGSVLVRIEVDVEGKPLKVFIKKSSGYEEFDDTAQSWILNRWLFNPAQENGRAVSSIVTTRIYFEYN